MLKGDLTSTPLAPLLLQLADDAPTGCLHIVDSADEEAQVYLKDGLIYSVSVPGSRPQLGAKLVSSGALAPEALAEALDAQLNELQGWRLGELLVHLGYVDQPVVEAFVREQVSEALWDLLRWAAGTWKFRRNVKAREDVGPPLAVIELLETLRERGYEWETISAVVHGPNAVPRLSTHGETDDETVLDNDAWSMLCKIDSERSVADLAHDCGYTMYEAGQIIVTLVQAGLVDIEEEIDVAGLQPYGATTLASALAGDLDDDGPDQAEQAADDADDADDADAMSRLARLVSEIASEHPNGDLTATNGTDPAGVDGDEAARQSVARFGDYQDSTMTIKIHGRSEESFAASIAHVSRALSDVLGDVAPATPAPSTDSAHASARPQPIDRDDPDWQRRQRLRSAAAAELATAQAMIESLRPGHDAQTPEFAGEVPRVVTTEEERRQAAAREAEQAARHAAEETARQAAEQFARAAAEEAQRLAAEQEAQRLAAEEAAVREAERLATEAAERAAIEEAQRLAAEEAERLATEAAERAAAEEEEQLAGAAEAAAEAERARAEYEATEEMAWAEYWQREDAEREAAEAAERAAAEAAEQLAAIEAERRAAEEAERLAAAEAAQEAERAAAAEAARAAAEEVEAAERRAAEEAERVAAEEADRQAAEQAETEAAEAAERAAAEEAERQETLAAEQAAADAAAEAAAAEDERAAAREAERLAAEEADRRADEAAAATALLVELASSDPDEKPPPPPEAVEVPEPQPEPETDADAEAVDDSAESDRLWGLAENTDTAALLRELSSLGVDDNREPAPPPPTHPRANRPTTGPEKKPKKKIGLFGL